VEKSGRLASHQENGGCYESVPDKEAGYRVGTEESSSAVSSVGWSGMQTLQAPVSIVVTVYVHCWINMLAIAIFSVGFLGALFMRGMILYDKGARVCTPEGKKKTLSIVIAENRSSGIGR